MVRIAVGGFQHETNTFAPSKAGYAVFETGGAWPGACYGADIFAKLEGANIPAAGAIQALRAIDYEPLGTAWAAASPSAHVTDEAFERIAGAMIERLLERPRVDGVYLDLHGAMVTESFEDGEGELLRRVREAVGPRVPIAVSLDLHANISPAMFEHADAMVAYRSYPHTDMAVTGARAVRLLERMLRTGARPARACRTFDFLTALPSQCSLIEPARGIYRALGEMENRHDVVLSFAPGFPMADVPDCGMTVFGYGGVADEVQACVERLHAMVAGAEKDFALELLLPPDAVHRARALGRAGAPVVLADTQDNPGAGGNGDTTELLAALIAQNAAGAVLGLLVDADSARRAHDAGAGATLAFALGGRSGVAGDAPLQGEFTVERLNHGNFTCTGPMFRGFRMQLGPMALLRSRAAPGVRVALASRKVQAGDQEMFRHLGVEPREQAILALKSSVHFRADFGPLAREVLVVKAIGPALADPAEYRWTRLRAGMRLRPLGPVYG